MSIPGCTEPVRIVPSPGADPIPAEAFVPDQLPPALDPHELSYRLQQPLLDAERALSLLEGTASGLENPHILISPFKRREAVQSSAIEDTYASVEEVARAEADLPLFDRTDDAVEVANYLRALEHGLASDLPISLRLIRELHAILLSHTRGSDRAPGEFRRVQNHIGRDVRFVPPPPNYVPNLLNDLERFVHAESDLPRLVQIALVHYQFETIHPFQDGNGRVGRLLITLQLCQRTQLSRPFVYISGHFERNRQEYYDRLLAVSREGDWYGWFAFFLRAVASQATDAQRRAMALRELRQELHRRVQFPRASALLPRIIDQLFTRLWLNARTVADDCGITTQAAANLIGKLEERGILTEATGGSYGRKWFATEIIDLIQRDLDEQP